MSLSRRPSWAVFALLLPLGNVSAEFLLKCVEKIVNPAVELGPWNWNRLTWIHAFSPMGALLLSLVVLVWEAAVVGFEQSSLKRLLHPSPSVRVDLFHLKVYACNLKAIFWVTFSLGLGQLFYFWLKQRYSLGLVAQSPYLPSLLLLVFVNSLLFYWVHRIMHTRLFWPLHQVHHSATELVVITNFRNHPLNLLIEMTLFAVSAAVLGARPEVEISYLVLNGIYQLWAHSSMDWRLHDRGLGFVQEWILLAPEEHRLHHSKNPEHWDRNYGSVPMWDKVFGSWLDSRAVPPPEEFGLTYEIDQKMLATLAGLFTVMARFLRLPVERPSNSYRQVSLRAGREVATMVPEPLKRIK